LAIAEPSSSSANPEGAPSSDESGQVPTGESGTDRGAHASTSGKVDSGDCGNGKSHGNAQGCGGGTTHTSRPTVTSAAKTTQMTDASPSTKTTTSQATSSQTMSSETTPTPTTSSQTTSSQTTLIQTTSQTSESTTPTTTTMTTTTTTSGVGSPGPGGGSGSGGAVGLPSAFPTPPSQMPPTEPPAIDVVPGVGAAAAQLPAQPITLPLVVAPMGGGGAGMGPEAPPLPGTPLGGAAEPPAGQEPLPASAGSNVTVPPFSYRLGYTDYLRNAGLSQVAALAVPGVTGMLVLTGAGGLLGYRQAKAGHAVHTSGTARFVN
jgi:hypothetical protein